MTSPKLTERLSSSHDTGPSRPTSEQAPGQSVQNSLPISVSSWRANAETHVTSHRMDLAHKIAPDDLFPKMLAAFEHVQEIVERGYKGAGNDIGKPLSRSEAKDVNQGSMFLRRGDEQKIVNSLGEESRHKRRKTYEDLQTDVLYTYSNGWIGKRAPPTILPFSINPYTPTHKLGHPTPSPPSTWKTPTHISAHPSYTSRKSLGGSLIEGSDVGAVSASEAFLKGFIEGQAKDKQHDMRRRSLGYHQSLA
jgi:hypothetical protein